MIRFLRQLFGGQEAPQDDADREANRRRQAMQDQRLADIRREVDLITRRPGTERQRK